MFLRRFGFEKLCIVGQKAIFFTLLSFLIRRFIKSDGENLIYVFSGFLGKISHSYLIKIDLFLFIKSEVFFNLIFTRTMKFPFVPFTLYLIKKVRRFTQSLSK